LAYLIINIKSKWLKFEFVSKKGKTSVWNVLHKDDTPLGQVYWFAQWRQYCFYPEDLRVFSGGCLEDIVKFMQRLRQKELIEAKKQKLTNA